MKIVLRTYAEISGQKRSWSFRLIFSSESRKDTWMCRRELKKFQLKKTLKMNAKAAENIKLNLSQHKRVAREREGEKMNKKNSEH